VNPALSELLLSTVLLLELPALVSGTVLVLESRKLEPAPPLKWVILAAAVGLSIPWTGVALGLVLTVFLGLATKSFWIPLVIGVSVSVLYLQLRWTQLILAEWREAREVGSAETNLDAEPSPQSTEHSDDASATEEPSEDRPSH
jgi:hypothetical protein